MRSTRDRARRGARSLGLALAGGGLAVVTRLLARLPIAPRGAGDARPDLGAARRIVVIRPDEIGDVVMTTAFLRELRRAAPTAHVTLVVNAAARPLVATCPHVDAVVTFRTAAPRALRPLVLPWRAGRLGRALRRGGPPDLVLLPRWGTDAVFATYAAYFTGARARVGFSEAVDGRKRALNRGFDRLLTHALPFDGWRHDVAHTFTMLRAVGAAVSNEALELWPDAADAAFAERALAPLRAGTGPVVALGPSGGHSVLKQWPPARFAALADRLREEFGASVVLVGAPAEEALAEAIRDGCASPPHSIVGATTLRQLAAVLRRCALYVGNDAGPLHVASAVGTPVVGIYGASDPTRFGPWAGRAQVVWRPPQCAPVHRPSRPDRCPRCVLHEPVCLTGISVADVIDACRAALDPRSADSPATAHTRTVAALATGD
jgi:heptosyltransferase-2